jgi:L-threonylcarbamoyladenylate synthase
MRIIKLARDNEQEVVGEAIKTLKACGLVVFPSDTVYGLLADAENPDAVTKLLKFKERRPGQAISVFMADKNMAEKYVRLNQNGLNVVNNLLPGPFTVIAESRHRADPRLEAENGTLGIRIPDCPPILELVATFGQTLTATSANLSGRPPHYSVSSLLKSLSQNKKSQLDLIVDAGNLPKNKPSTVIDTTTGQLKTLRAGALLPQTPNSLLSRSEKNTEELAQFLAAKLVKIPLSKPIVFLLEGELGTGKTVFTRGLGKALGVKEKIASPTFNICAEYRTNLRSKVTSSDTESYHHNEANHNKRPQPKFIHCDFYRLETKEEFAELGFPENVSNGNVYAFEWSERLPEALISALKNRAEIVYLRLKHAGENQRIIEWGKN